MSDYSEIYYELNKEYFKREELAKKYRQQMRQELSWEDMIKIMFADFIDKQNINTVIGIAGDYLIDRKVGGTNV